MDIFEPKGAPGIPADTNTLGIRLTSLCGTDVRLRIFPAPPVIGFYSANVNFTEEPHKPRTVLFINRW